MVYFGLSATNVELGIRENEGTHYSVLGILFMSFLELWLLATLTNFCTFMAFPYGGTISVQVYVHDLDLDVN